MSILGIDYGAKKIGLALSDEQQRLAFPLTVIVDAAPDQLLKQLKDICQQHQVERVIVGVPISLKAEKRQTFWRQKDLQNQQMRNVLAFVTWLTDQLDVPVEVEDERLSTKQANRLGVKGHDDAVAAMLVLQTYLDRRIIKQK